MSSNVKMYQQVETIFKKPKMFCVILHNDDYTTTDFVVDVLMKVFHKTAPEANMVMLEVHEGGVGIAGVYTYDVAMTKKIIADKMAKENEFPLKITLDEAML